MNSGVSCASLAMSRDKTIVIDYRFGDGRFDRLPQLAAEVRLNVDVIVSVVLLTLFELARSSMCADHASIVGAGTLCRRSSVHHRCCRQATPNRRTIEGSRAVEGRVLEQSQSQGRRQWSTYRVRVAGQRSTYVFNCIHSGQATVIQPLGMR